MTATLVKVPKIRARRSLDLHLAVLRAFGYYPLDPNHWSKRVLGLHQIYSAIMCSGALLYYAFELRFLAEHLHEVDVVTPSYALLLTHLVSIGKQLILRYKASKIMTLINEIDGPFFNQGYRAHNEILEQMVTDSRRVMILYVGSAVFTSIVWTVQPFLDKKSLHLPFWASFPFDEDKTPWFQVAYFYEFFVVFMQSFVNTTTDSLICALIANASAQFKIVCYNIEKIVEIANDKIVEESLEPTMEMFDGIVEFELIKCLKHHNYITVFALEIEDTFHFAIFLQFLASATIICATAYRMSVVSINSMEFYSLLIFLLVVLIETFLYCYYGNDLYTQSAALTNSIYNSQWLLTNISLRKSMIIFMERSKREIKMTAGKMITLNLETYISIINSSYSFFALLKGMN